MELKNFVLRITILILITIFPNYAFSTGACCVIGKGAANKFALSLAVSFAKNHENLNNEVYNLSQYAAIVKFNYPLFQNFVVQAQAGLPVQTYLEHHQGHEFKGSSGFNLGISAGYLLPEMIDNLEFFFSVGYSFTKSYLDKENKNEFKQDMDVSEFQAVLIGEYKVSSNLYLNAGVRLYGSKIDLKNNLASKSGSHLGSLGYLIGLRFSFIDNFDLNIESGFGHTNIGSVGLMYYL